MATSRRSYGTFRHFIRWPERLITANNVKSSFYCYLVMTFVVEVGTDRYQHIFCLPHSS